MPRQKNTVLNKQAREIIYNVNVFMQAECDAGVANLKSVQQRTALATRTSVKTVWRIMKEGIATQAEFKTPGKCRKKIKTITAMDTFDHGTARRIIHNYLCTKNEMPAVKELRQILKKEMNYKGAVTSLRQILKSIGFTTKLTQNNKIIFVESSEIRYKRIDFIERLNFFRKEGRPIVYVEETFVDSKYLIVDPETDKSSKSRVMIVYAATEAGILQNTLLTFQGDIKKVNYHWNFNCDDYEKWLCDQLIPNLPENSVVVFNNELYHKRLYDPAPNSDSKKIAMQSWLTDKGINYTENMLKPQLYNLIKRHREQFKKYKIEKILSEHNHDMIRLPPFHKDLNLANTASPIIKAHIDKKKFNWSVIGVTDAIKEKLNNIDDTEWTKICKTSKNIEKQYIKSDCVLDKIFEELALRNYNGNESNESEDEILDDEEEAEEMEEEICEVGESNTDTLTVSDCTDNYSSNNIETDGMEHDEN